MWVPQFLRRFPRFPQQRTELARFFGKRLAMVFAFGAD
jgi:hypothetical protein